MPTAMLARAETKLYEGLIATGEGVLRWNAFVDERKNAESRVAWFAIVLPLVVLAGLGIFAYLTVQCWNRGYSGFTGQWSMTQGWTSATIKFACA